MMELLQEPIVVIAEQQIAYINPAGAVLFGAAAPEEIIGEEISRFLPRELHQKTLKQLAFLQRRPSVQPFATTLVPLDGEQIEMRGQAVPIAYGERRAVLVMFRDLDIQEYLAKAYQCKENILLQILKFSPKAVILHTQDRILYANDAAGAMLRSESAEKLVGRNLYDFIGEDLHEEIREQLAKVGKATTRLDFPIHRMIRADGSVFEAEAFSVIFEDMNGKKYIQTVLRDISRQIAHGKQMLESSRRFQRLIEFLPEPIAVCEAATNLVIYCNQSMAKLVKADNPLDLVGVDIYEFIHPEDYASSKDIFHKVLELDQATPFVERRLRCKNGDVINVELSGIRLQDDDGTMVILGVFRDVTERKKAEELLLRSEKLSVIGQLAAGVAHEIRNPLTSLKGFTQILKKELDPQKYYYIDTMLSELDRISSIVNDFMGLSKPQHVTFRYHDAREMLAAILSVLETEAALYNISFQWDFPEHAPQVFCDENRIKQVFLNVIKNAMEAMPDGGIIRIVANIKDNRLLIRVIDEGCGIPEEIIAKVKEPFFTTKHDGTGLGLMICQRILEDHQGALHIASKPGVGTTIDISLPIHP